MDNIPTSAETDWAGFLRDHDFGDKIDLTTLRNGAIIVLATRNTRYRLSLIEEGSRWFEVTSDRPDKPHGRMKLIGGALGLGSSLMPDALFTGGMAEFRQPTDDPKTWLTHTTSSIEAIALLQVQ